MRLSLFTLIFAAMAVSACGTTATGESYIGKPYVQPTSSEAAAELIFAGGRKLEIVNVDAKNCYSGKTSISRAVGEPGKQIGYRVHADKRLVLHYEGAVTSEARYIGKACAGLDFYFTPKKDAKYTMITGQISLQNEKASAVAKLLGNDKGDYCVVNMVQEAEDGTQSIVELTKTRPKQTGFACIQF